MKQETLEKLWEHELTILDEIDRICKKYSLNYFLMWGTLIGAVRHKGFIPWDDDIDIGMPRDDYKKFLKIASKELPDKLFLQTPLTDKFHPVYFSKIRMNNTAFYSKQDKNTKKHHGIFVDILPMDYTSEHLSTIGKIKRKISNILSAHIFSKRENLKDRFSFLNVIPDFIIIKLRDRMLSGKGEYFFSEGYTFKAKDFFPADTLEFAGKTYPVPNNYDEVLRSVYGDYMTLPPEEKRVAHNPGRISFDLTKPDEEIFD